MRSKLIPLIGSEKLRSNMGQIRQKEFEDLKESIKNLSECVMQMTQSIKQMKKVQASDKQSKPKQIVPEAPQTSIKTNSQRMEQRFQDINFEIPQLKEDEKQRLQTILSWLTEACKTVFSVGFNLYETGVLDINKTKAFCSENVLRNLFYLCQKNKLTPFQFFQINNFLEEDLLPYFCQKYPQSEQAETSAKFSSDLIERDALQDNEYDLVYKSRVDFSFQQSGNYNSQIMKFLNYIMQLPNKNIQTKHNQNQPEAPNPNPKQKDKKQKQLNQQFFKEMEKIFRMVQVENNTVNMQRFNPRKQELFQWTVDESSEKERQEYQQKVRTYTSFQIGQKLSKNLKLFSQFQIETGDLKLKNSEVMRVLTKWCEQLQKYYDEQLLLQKQGLFRMKDGSQKQIDEIRRTILGRNLAQQKYRYIQSMRELIVQNNCTNQSQLMNQETDKDLKKISESQASVGQFASYIFKNNASYLITYLNVLIHGINKATKSYSQMWSLTPGSIPQLITFKIGDLMRCKCSSKEKEIIALYKEIERRHRLPNSDIRIIRVKNRLNRGNKDILMNLLYKGEMVVEMQLAIKSDKSKFIECSYNFNHYLYELKRAQFGPIMQMCNVWINKDLKSKYFLQKIQKLNTKAPQDPQSIPTISQKLKSCCLPNKLKVKLPFRCSICKCFYSSSSQIQSNIVCNQCESYTCYMCQLEISEEERDRLFGEIRREIGEGKEGMDGKEGKDGMEVEKFQNVRFVREVEKLGGVILNLKSKKKKPVYFFMENHKSQNYLFEYEESKDEVKLITKLKSKQFPQSFLKQNLVFTSPSIQTKIQQLHQKSKTPTQTYFLQTFLKSAYKTQKNSLYLTNQTLNPQKFQLKQIDNWPSVVRVDFSGSRDICMREVVGKFPNVLKAVLNRVEFREKEGQKEKEGDWGRFWKDLRVVEMRGNRIEGMEFLGECTKIVSIDMSDNQISTIPESIKNFPNLTTLSLQSNKLHLLPAPLFTLPLQHLHLSVNSLQTIPNALTNLTQLRTLYLSFNQLTQLPEQIGKLKKLEVLNLRNNRLGKLPHSVADMGALRELDLEENLVEGVPGGVGALGALRRLGLSNNRVRQLPESIGGMRSLMYLQLKNNQLTTLPQSLSQLQCLQSLQLSKNTLPQIPPQILSLPNLQTLTFTKNPIASLPMPLLSLPKLSTLTFSILTQNFRFDCQNFTVRRNGDLKLSIEYLKEFLGVVQKIKEFCGRSFVNVVTDVVVANGGLSGM